MSCGSSFELADKPISSATGPNKCRLTARCPELFMCVARKSGPGREYSVAVDWRDCAWFPRIVVQFPAVAHPGSPFKNAFSRSSRGNEAQISLETIIRLEPPH